MNLKQFNTTGDKIFLSINNILLFILFLLVVYPLLYVLSASFSSVSAVLSGQVTIFPVDFSTVAYKAVLEHQDIPRAFVNSVLYVIVGTSINMLMTILAAYPLSRKDMYGKEVFMFVFLFTMYFNGGLIPNYLLIRDLKLLNSFWVMVVPAAVNIWNVIIAKTYFQNNIPDELLDAAKIDGCNEKEFLIKIVIPLSKSILAVLALFYAVAHWNSFFNAFLYLTNRKLFPLQLILREILIINQIDVNMLAVEDIEKLAQKEGMRELLKYSTIVVSTVPVLIIYPFIQKYFVSGIMIGSVKG